MADEIIWKMEKLNVGAIDVHSTYPEVSEINYLLKAGEVEKVMAYLHGEENLFDGKKKNAYDAYIDARASYISSISDANVEIVTLWSALGEVESSKAYIKDCDRHFRTMDRTGEVPKNSIDYKSYEIYIKQLDIAFMSGSYGSKCLYSATKQMLDINPKLNIFIVQGPVIWGPNPGTIYDELSVKIIPQKQITKELTFLKNNYDINDMDPSIPQ
ncbi:hypothetical protein GQ473_01650 [archaeon]|nr:hypothetical protein [archaeon]